MKKVLCGVVAVVMMLCLTACGNTCNEQNCSQQKVPGFDYCSTHKCCHYYNCNEDRIKKSNFCAKHTCAHPGCYEAVSVVCGQESRYCGRHQDDENQSVNKNNNSDSGNVNNYGGGNWAKFSGNWEYSGSLYQGSYIGQVDDGVKYAHLYIDSSNREATITTKNGTYVYALNEIEAFDDGTLYITGTLQNGDSLMGYNWAFLYGSDNLGATITAFNRADKSGMIFRK